MSDLSIEFQIADAVAFELNNAGLSIDPDAKRKVLPQFKISQLDDYVVSVVPRAIPEEFKSQRSGVHQVLVRVDIYVMKRIGVVGDAPGGDNCPNEIEVEAVCQYAEEIALAMRLRELSQVPDAKYDRKERPEIYDMDMLDNRGVCACPILLYYWVRQ